MLLAVLLVFAAVGFISTATPASANPSNRNPNAPLAVHATVPEAKALAASLYATYDRVRVIELEAIA